SSVGDLRGPVCECAMLFATVNSLCRDFSLPKGTRRDKRPAWIDILMQTDYTGSMRRSGAPMRRWFLLAVLLTLWLGIMAGCVSSRKPSESPLVIASATQSEYAGSEACAPCHAAESQGFRETNHALTMRPMTPAALTTLAPPPGPLPDTGCVLETAG